MTFSIVAADLDRAEWGVAVASRYLAVGAIVPAAKPNAGALATQASGNVLHHAEILDLLASGVPAEDALATVLARDEERSQRQVGVVDHAGGSATWTGEDCRPYSSAIHGPGYAVLGNLLTSRSVVDDMESAWIRHRGEGPLAWRLHDVLKAGQRAGGDLRGRQAAAVLTIRTSARYIENSAVEVDLRVDDHADPLAELKRLLSLRYGDSGEPR
ncbi:MAG: DUF1028 domain-containing protein [Kineosporiaceae bacterium]